MHSYRCGVGEDWDWVLLLLLLQILLLLMLQTLLLVLLFPVPSLMLEKIFETQESLLWLGIGGHYWCMHSRYGDESGNGGEDSGGCSRRIKTKPQHGSLRLDRIAGELASSYKLAKNSGSALIDT
jgi:hypothetical protein